jgi:hypothetical protein
MDARSGRLTRDQDPGAGLKAKDGPRFVRQRLAARLVAADATSADLGEEVRQ